MHRTIVLLGDGISSTGSLWQKVRHYLCPFLRAKSTIKGTHLLDLNDDCLREIMSFLTDDDLCSIAESSTESSIRLKDIATETFKRSHKFTNSNAMSACNIFGSRRVFQNFGSVFLENVFTFTNLTSLRIDCHDQQRAEFIFIQDLNSLKLLTSLSLWSVRCVPEFLPTLAKQKQLRCLQLIYCELNDLNPLTDLDNLQKLYIIERNSYEKLDFDIVGLVNRMRNLHTLCVFVGKFRLDKQTYLTLVDLVREEARERLWLLCAFDKNVADTQNVGLNRSIVDVFEQSEICRWKKKLKRYRNFAHALINALDVLDEMNK